MTALTPTLSLKQQAHALIDQLPDAASWADLAYAADVRASIERGLEDLQAGRMISTQELLREFGLEE